MTEEIYVEGVRYICSYHVFQKIQSYQITNARTNTDFVFMHDHVENVNLTELYKTMIRMFKL
jgi:hypothetical protein